MEKRITFIIPAYNEEKHIEKSLNSILSQNMTDVEIILIDDGSADKTYEIMKSFQRKYSFVKVFHSDESYGPSHARNIGIANAKGKYLWFLDADDYLLEDAISTVLKETEGSGLDCLLFSFKRERDGISVNNASEYDLKGVDSKRVYTGRELFTIKVEQLSRVPDKMSFVVLRSFVEENRIKFVEGVIYEDGMFFLDIYMNARSIRQIMARLFVYCNNVNSVGHAGFDRTYSVACCFYKYYYFLKKGLDIEDMDFKRIYTRNLMNLFEDVSVLQSKLLREDDPVSVLNRIDTNAAMMFTSIFSKKEEDFSKYEKFFVDASDIIVYGAKDKAKRIAKYIDAIDKKIAAYIVSDELFGEKDRNNPFHVYGVPVIPFSKIETLSRDSLVVITLRKVYWDDTIDKLKSKEFRNIICIE